MAQMGGAVIGFFGFLFLWDVCSKKHWSTLSGPRMTMGFGPFELPTRGLLQKGRDYSPPKGCFEEFSFWLAYSAMGIHSAMNTQITKFQSTGVIVILIRGWANGYCTGFWLTVVSSWRSIWEADHLGLYFDDFLMMSILVCV